MDPKSRQSIRDMLRFARKAMSILGERTADELQSNEEKLFALTYVVGLIGEASRNVDESVRAELTEIPWVPIGGMRNRLFHGYNDIDSMILVKTVRDFVPALVAALERALKDEAS